MKPVELAGTGEPESVSGDTENLKVIRLGSLRPDPAALRAAVAAALLALAAFPILSYFLAMFAALPLGNQIAASGIDVSPGAEIDAAWIEKASGLLLAVKKGSYVLKAVTAFLALSLALGLFRRADKPLAIAFFGGAYLLLVPGLGLWLEPIPGMGSAGTAAACLALYAWFDWQARRAAA